MEIEILDIGCFDFPPPGPSSLVKTNYKILVLKKYNADNTQLLSTEVIDFNYGGPADFNIGVGSEVSNYLLRNRIKSVEIDKVSTLYIAPNSVVPRYRLKELKDKNNINVTRDCKKADLVVLGDKCFSEHISSIYVSGIIKTKTIREDIYSAIVNLHPAYVDYNIRMLQQRIEETMSADLPEYCYLSYGLKKNIDLLISKAKLSSDSIYTKSGCRLLVVDEKISSIINLCDNQFMLDKDFVATFGESVIDHDSYKFIDNLLSSNNNESIQVALTLMANCNFNNSHGYLLLLYYKHKDLIYQEYRKLISYKSLYMFLNKSIMRNIDSLINCLDSYGLLTDLIKTEIKELYKSERKLNVSGSSRIVIKNIEIEII